MQSITISKAKLIELVATNRAKHETEYKAAFIKFCEQAIPELKKRLDCATYGSQFDLTFKLAAPIDNRKDYDRVLSMLSLAEDEDFRLSEEDYRAYVEDDWGWRHHSRMVNTSYTRVG